MKILISCGLFYPAELGGPAKSLYWLAKGFIASGNDVTVVALYDKITDKQIIPGEWMNIDGIRVKYCKKNIYLSFNQIIETIKVIKECDVVILSSVCYFPEFPIALVAHYYKKKLIWSPRGEFSKEAIAGNVLKKIYFNIIKFSIGKYCIFHSTSQAEYADIKFILGEESHVVNIPNYMELPLQQCHDENVAPFFLYLGRIAPIKALENLIYGLVLSKQFRKSDINFYFAGDVEEKYMGYYRKLQNIICEEGLENKLKFIGLIRGCDKYQLCANARFLFLVSHSENFGNVVVEALSQGTPVVASNGTPWIELEIKNAGFWIENSPEEIADVVDKILTMSKKDYLRYRDNAYNYAQSFDVYKNMEKWLKAISM